MKTVLEVIQATTAYFTKHGVESPRLNIEHLLAHTLGLKRMDLYLKFDQPLSDEQLTPLRELVRRRVAGEPLQHLLGNVEFLGRTFVSDKRALIPRPETEQLCEMLIAQYRETPPPARVLDVGVGSGVIALSLAGAWAEAAVEAVDLHPEPLTLARENASRLGLESRVTFRQSDLLREVEGEFGLIVANLPYIPAHEIASLSREVQRDPASALDGGPAGTELIFRLAAEAAAHLRGLLALEIGLGQAEKTCEELRRLNYQEVRAASDYQGVHRFVFAKYG